MYNSSLIVFKNKNKIIEAQDVFFLQLFYLFFAQNVINILFYCYAQSFKPVANKNRENKCFSNIYILLKNLKSIYNTKPSLNMCFKKF